MVAVILPLFFHQSICHYADSPDQQADAAAAAAAEWLGSSPQTSCAPCSETWSTAAAGLPGCSLSCRVPAESRGRSVCLNVYAHFSVSKIYNTIQPWLKLWAASGGSSRTVMPFYCCATAATNLKNTSCAQ